MASYAQHLGAVGGYNSWRLRSHAKSMRARGEWRTNAVKLVNERNAWHVVASHLTINRKRLTLHAAHATEYHYGTVQYAQRPFHLDRKIHVARRVDDIDQVIAPANDTQRWRRRDLRAVPV